VVEAKTLDLRRQWKYLYQPSAKQVSVVEVPPFQFAMIDGQIEPGRAPADSPAFQEAVAALYGVAYTLKFTSKLRPLDPIDYPVMALEGLWWVENGQFSEFDINRPEGRRWTLMIMQPDNITPEMFADGLRLLVKKRGEEPAFSRLRLERFAEGLCLQIMHIGPYSEEPATLARIHAFAEQNGYQLYGKHHEIYLGDPRRSAPDKLKTVLRRPITR